MADRHQRQDHPEAPPDQPSVKRLVRACLFACIAPKHKATSKQEPAFPKFRQHPLSRRAKSQTPRDMSGTETSPGASHARIEILAETSRNKGTGEES
jgi:hypothetical protein